VHTKTMAEEHMSNDEFFGQLSDLLKSPHIAGHGSIYLTQKRLTYSLDPSSPSTPAEKIADNPLWDLNPPNPLPILVRATDGKSKVHRKKGEKVKLSTVVKPEDIEGFFVKYAEVAKKGFEGLKPKVRRKGKKKGKGKGGKKEEGT